MSSVEERRRKEREKEKEESARGEVHTKGDRRMREKAIRERESCIREKAV